MDETNSSKAIFSIPDFYNNFRINLFLLQLMKQEPQLFDPNVIIGSIYGTFPGCIWNGGSYSGGGGGYFSKGGNNCGGGGGYYAPGKIGGGGYGVDFGDLGTQSFAYGGSIDKNSYYMTAGGNGVCVIQYYVNA